MAIEIHWLGDGCFRIRCGNAAALMDPYEDERVRPAARLVEAATITTVSGESSKHGLSARRNGPKTIAMPGEYELDGLMIRGVMIQASDGATDGERNVAYAMTIDGLNICHTGRMQAEPTPAQMDLLGPADVVLAPQGRSDEGATTVEKVARRMGARLLIPGGGPEPTTPFIEQSEPGARSPARIAVTRASLPEGLKVVHLSAQTERVPKR